MTGASAAALTTFAPELAVAPDFLPTGNLSVALPEVARSDGSVRSLGVVLASCAAVLTAHGGPAGLATPRLTVDGTPVAVTGLRWQRDGDWLPHFTMESPDGVLEGWYVAPTDERGVVLRLHYLHRAQRPAYVELRWEGSWCETSVEHLRSKPVDSTLTASDDAWTATRVVTASTGLPLLAVAWRGGEGVDLVDDGSGTGWRGSRTAGLEAGGTLVAEVFLGVAPEPDGACTTALHLRRRGFGSLHDETARWLAAHRLDVPGDQALASVLNANLFFNWFYAQADCLDDGRPVLLTSRSPHYYVCAALWSRDAYCWTFPALLLTDAARARAVLVATLHAGGTRLADHALYLNGTRLYPGFELDQAAAPVLAVARYVAATSDWGVLCEPGVADTLLGLVRRTQHWRHPDCELYATFLLPTDDPTDYPYVTTCNALLAAALDALAGLAADAPEHGIATLADPDLTPDRLHARAVAIRVALRERLVVVGPRGRMWAWACNAEGRTELRDEAPLGLLTLPWWGLGDSDDEVFLATRRWLREDYPHQYAGRFAGAGAPHFPHPSGFDLANRLLDRDPTAPDPLRQLSETPMDQGLACESWDVDTGRVRTGAAMASMAGLLVWTAWSRLGAQTRWDEASRHADAHR